MKEMPYSYLYPHSTYQKLEHNLENLRHFIIYSYMKETHRTHGQIQLSKWKVDEKANFHLQLHISIGILLIVGKLAFRRGDESVTVDNGEEKMERKSSNNLPQGQHVHSKVGMDRGPALTLNLFCSSRVVEPHSVSQPLLSSALPSPNQPWY